MCKQVLVYFFHRYLDFRKAEVEALARMAGWAETLKWKPACGDGDTPFWYITVPSDLAAKELAERSVLIKSIIEVWAEGDDDAWVAAQAAKYDAAARKKYFSPDCSFKIVLDGFGKAATVPETKEKIELYGAIGFRGKVKMSNPDELFWNITCYGGDIQGNDGTNGIEDCNDFIKSLNLPRWVCFGRELGSSKRKEFLRKLDLKQRPYLGPTSMDTELALLMSNQGGARRGSLVYDPFTGTGSILLAATYFGAYTWGGDMDIRVLRDGRNGKTNWTNFNTYKMQHPLALVRCDNHSPPFRPDLECIFDAIICDPPYGIRAGGRKSGGRKILSGKVEPYRIEEKYRADHIPSTAPYPLGECLADLLDLAARLLVVGGRLVYFIPSALETYSPQCIPVHPGLKLIANCEQMLTRRWGRRLITMEKCSDYDASLAPAAKEDIIQRVSGTSFADNEDTQSTIAKASRLPERSFAKHRGKKT